MNKPVMPSAPEAEQAVLGAWLDGVPFDAVPLTEGHFHSPAHRHVYHAVQGLTGKGAPVNLISVTSSMRTAGTLDAAGGPGVLAELLSVSAGGEAAVRYYFHDLEAVRQARGVVAYCGEHLPELSAMKLSASEFAGGLVEISAPQAASQWMTGHEVIDALEDEMRGTPPEAFPFGIPALDDSLKGGIRPGQFFVIAGDTGKGKSALMIQAAGLAAQKGTPVLYISLEMPATDVWKRAVSAATRTSQTNDSFRGKLNESESWPLLVSSTEPEASAVCSMIRAAVRKQKVRLVVVDYLQIMHLSGESNRERAVSECARQLLVLSATENVAILTGSQLNENGQLRESRAPAHHADAVLAIADGAIQCPKFRHGPSLWSVPAVLRGEVSRFFPCAK